MAHSNKKEEYWRARAIELVIQAMRNSVPQIKQAVDCLRHIDAYDEKTKNAFIQVNKSYDAVVSAIYGRPIRKTN